MPYLPRLLSTIAIIFCSIAIGWLARRAAETGKIPIAATSLEKLRKYLQTSAIFFLLPFSAMLSLWGLPHPRAELLILPLLGLLSYICGGIMAICAARLLRLDRRQSGSFFCCGTFTNIGAVGGLVCLFFLGENTIALVALYRLVEELYYFSIAFPIAQWFGSADSNTRFNLRAFRISPMLIAVILALLLGITLNLAQVYRPSMCTQLASLSMVIATVFFLFSIGITLHFTRLKGDIGKSIVICAIKFIGIPAIVIPVAWACGLGQFESGLPLKTVAILCSMPVAMTALVPPSLFGLDVDLANACWIFSTVCLVIVLPALMWLLPML